MHYFYQALTVKAIIKNIITAGANKAKESLDRNIENPEVVAWSYHDV